MPENRKPWADRTTSRQSRGYGRAHERIRAEMMRTIVLCEECRRKGKTTVGTIADHIKPLSQGGTGDRSNYQLLCKQCDLDKQVSDRGGTPKQAFGPDGWPL